MAVQNLDINIASHSAMLTNELILKQIKLLDESIIKIITYNDTTSIKIAYATLINLFSYLYATDTLNKKQKELINQQLDNIQKQISQLNGEEINLNTIKTAQEQIIDLTFLIKYLFQQYDYFFRITKEKETLFSYYKNKFKKEQNQNNQNEPTNNTTNNT